MTIAASYMVHWINHNNEEDSCGPFHLLAAIQLAESFRKQNIFALIKITVESELVEP